MSFWRRLSVCLLLLCFFETTRAQSPPSAPVDYYSKFVGKWAGTDHYRDGDSWIDLPVQITITTSRKNDRLRFDYVYGNKGDKDFDRKTRFLTLDPAKEELTLQWDDAIKDHYKTSGLDRFTKAGHGSFLAANRSTMDGNNISSICSFSLKENTFTYSWQTTSDGKAFQQISTFSFKRVPSSAVARPTP